MARSVSVPLPRVGVAPGVDTRDKMLTPMGLGSLTGDFYEASRRACV